MNSIYSEYVIIDNDYSYESRKIKDYISSLFKRLTTAIDASAIKIINNDLIIISLSLQIIHLNNFTQNTLTVNIHTVLNTTQH